MTLSSDIDVVAGPVASGLVVLLCGACRRIRDTRTC